MADRRPRLKPLHRAIAIAAAVVLVALQQWFEPGYFLVLNTLILVLALLLAFVMLGLRHAWAYGLAAFLAGTGWHALEVWLVIRAGECRASSDDWLAALARIDECLDYTEQWVLPAQSLLVAGAVVVLIVVISDASSAVAWWRRQRVLERLRKRR